MSNRRYTYKSKAEAVTQITERGYSAKKVSERLGISIKSMYVWLKEAKGSRMERRLDQQGRRKKVTVMLI